MGEDDKENINPDDLRICLSFLNGQIHHDLIETFPNLEVYRAHQNSGFQTKPLILNTTRTLYYLNVLITLKRITHLLVKNLKI